MMFLELFLLSYYIASLDAFLTPPSLHASSCNVNSIELESSWKVQSPFSSSPLLQHRSCYSTILRADADASTDGAEVDYEEDPPSDTSASLLPSEEESDILSSPTFLKRKVEVLQSDIAALEKEIEEANAVAAKGKEEWSAKFEMLNKEVRELHTNCFIYS